MHVVCTLSHSRVSQASSWSAASSAVGWCPSGSSLTSQPRLPTAPHTTRHTHLRQHTLLMHRPPHPLMTWLIIASPPTNQISPQLPPNRLEPVKGVKLVVLVQQLEYVSHACGRRGWGQLGRASHCPPFWWQSPIQALHHLPSHTTPHHTTHPISSHPSVRSHPLQTHHQ